MTDSDLSFASIEQIGRLFRKRKLSPVELTRFMLARIEQLNAKLNAYLTVTAELALAQAKKAEAELFAPRGGKSRRDRGPLHGIPISLKDNIYTKDVRTTAGSKILKDFVPEHDATVVAELKEAGAVVLGKTNLHEFAYGVTTNNPHFGPARNPWDLSRIPGGSSGGSAAAVAAGLCYGAIGTDTAGSIREPAALCGVVGLKPTYDRVSAWGVIPLSWSLDHVGPIAATVADAAVILQAIAGFDATDINSEDIPVADYVAGLGNCPKTLRIGVPRAYFFEGLDAEIEFAVKQALSVLSTLGADIREIQLEAPTDRTVQSAESYAYHAEHVTRTPELYQTETLRRIRTGADVSGTDYIHRRRELEKARREIRKAFE